MRGRTRSSAKRVSPVTFAHASILGSDWPMTENLPGVMRSPLHAERRQLDGVEDLRVTGAAAEIAGQRHPHLVTARGGIVLEERLRGEENARGAVAALGGAELGEGLLEGMEPGPAGHALDRRDRLTLRLDGERQTRQRGLAVDEHGAGAALAQLAAVLGAREPEILAQDLEQRLVDGDDQLPRLAIDRECQLRLHPAALPWSRFRCLSSEESRIKEY